MAQMQEGVNTRTMRRGRGFRAAASLLSGQLGQAALKRGFAVSRLLTHWSEVAGEPVASMARPVSVTHGRGNIGATLTLLCHGAVGPIVEMQLPRLRDRVNACYGYNAIHRIRLTQSSATGFAEAQAAFAPAPPKVADPETLRAADAVGARFGDPQLAEAMARLALNLSMRTKNNPRKDIPC